MCGHYVKQRMDQQNMVANPAQSPFAPREFSLARQVSPSRPAPACLFPTVMLNLCVGVCRCSSHDQPIGPKPYPVIYVVANSVRGPLYRKRSEEQLQSSSENIKQNKAKTTKRKEKKRTKKQIIPNNSN